MRERRRELDLLAAQNIATDTDPESQAFAKPAAPAPEPDADEPDADETDNAADPKDLSPRLYAFKRGHDAQ